MYGLTIDTGPATEPITLAEAKAHLRIDHTDDDTYITTLIIAARRAVEEYLGRALITQTLVMTLDEFPGSNNVIYLPRSPVQSITTLDYIDDNGTTQTWSSANYKLDTSSLVPRLVPVYGETWPTTRNEINAVTVTFVAGYGAAAAVPETIKQGILLIIGTYFDVFRETAIVGDSVAIVPQAAGFLLGPFRTATHAGALWQ